MIQDLMPAKATKKITNILSRDGISDTMTEANKVRYFSPIASRKPSDLTSLRPGLVPRNNHG